MAQKKTSKRPKLKVGTKRSGGRVVLKKGYRWVKNGGGRTKKVKAK